MKEFARDTFSVWLELKIDHTADLLRKREDADRTLNTSLDPFITLSAFFAYSLYEILYETSRYDLWLFNAISKALVK